MENVRQLHQLEQSMSQGRIPLPNIDRLVDGATMNCILNFLDAYSRYNHIPLASADMIKTAFITKEANYYYKVMPFDLKKTLWQLIKG